MRGVYAIADITALDAKGVDAHAFAEAAIAGGACALQLRAKGADAARMTELARTLGAIASAAHVPFFVNDAVELAIAGGHHGVHLGQHDLGPGDAQAMAARSGRRIAIGVSTHSDSELVAALAQPIAYLAIGPVFETSSKERLEPVLGVEGALTLAARARRQRPDLPLIAIGGIDEQRAASLRGAFDALAVIGALLPGPAPQRAEICERVRSLRAAFAGTS